VSVLRTLFTLHEEVEQRRDATERPVGPFDVVAIQEGGRVLRWQQLRVRQARGVVGRDVKVVLAEALAAPGLQRLPCTRWPAATKRTSASQKATA